MTNPDYEVFNNFGENPNGGRPLIEYALSVDMAKELSMLEGNEKFADWIKNRIEKYGFIENQDFEVFDNFIKNLYFAWQM